MTQDFPNTVGDAAQRWHDNHVRDRARNSLHSAMGCPRWDLLPVEESPKPDRNLKWMLSALGIGVVVCGVMWWAAGAGPFRF